MEDRHVKWLQDMELEVPVYPSVQEIIEKTYAELGELVEEGWLTTEEANQIYNTWVHQYGSRE